VGPELTAAVLTRNEEGNLPDCLRSLAWADRLLVLDSFSEDATVELARAAGAAVHQGEFVNWSVQRNLALELAETPWVLFVDADERVPPELAAEVSEALRANQEARHAGGEPPAGYWLPRRNYIFGRWVRHAGWSPDHQLRLLYRSRARYDESREVHELVLLDGPEARLTNPLVHYNYATLEQFHAKQRRYAHHQARTLHCRGVRARARNFVLQPLREFNRRYFTWRGYREGWLGLKLSVLMAYYELQTYRNLHALGK
jgi:(heptosyl)LPS beta-1,4-glucosyltransferase